MPATKHDQRKDQLQQLIEAAKRAALVRKTAKAALTPEMEEGEEV